MKCWGCEREVLCTVGGLCPDCSARPRGSVKPLNTNSGKVDRYRVKRNGRLVYVRRRKVKMS